MSTQKFTPITTVDQLITVSNIVRTIIQDPEEIAKLDRAIVQAEKHGLPNAGDYSLKHIKAESEDDFNLKLSLLSLPVFKELAEGNISMGETNHLIMPLLHAILAEVMKHAEFGGETATLNDLIFPIDIHIDD